MAAESRGRSTLAVPGGDERKLAKAAGTAADEILVDLEDAVPVSGKSEARAVVAAWLASGAARSRVSVRVNAPRTPWCHLDLAAAVDAGDAVASVVVPKVESAGDLAFVERLLDGLEAAAGRTKPLRVHALIETPAGVANLDEICRATPRLAALVIGYADLGAALGRSPAAPWETWLPTQDRVLCAARAAGVRAIDGPHLGIAVDDAFTSSLLRARELGFDGKWVIHPQQVDAVNTAFTPEPVEVARARAVLDALAAAAARGDGTVALDGQMLDEAVAVAARRLLARAGEETR